MSDIELITVMPVYNEEANIAAVVREWLSAITRENVAGLLIVVNDGSRDATHTILNQLQAEFPDRVVVIGKPNSGHGRSCRVGYDAALEQRAPWIFQIDSDGQCDPAHFPQLWDSRHEADCIFGIRVVRDDGYLRKLISIGCRILTAIVTGHDLKDANVPYRLIKSAVLKKALQSVPRDFDLQNIALTLALKRDPTLRWAYVPIRFRARQGGTSSINLPKIARMGFRMLMEIKRVQR